MILFSRPNSRPRKIMFAFGIFGIFASILIPHLAITFHRTHTLGDSNPQTIPARSQKLSNGTQNSKTVANSKSQKIERENLSPAAQQTETILGTPAEAAKVKSWFSARGYSSWSGKANEYDSYSEETLKILVDANDILAMHALAMTYIDKDHAAEYGVPATLPLYTKAALYGSTDAFEGLARGIQITVFDEAKSEGEKRATAIEILALYNTASLRGDRWLNYSEAGSFKRLNRIVLSLEEQQRVIERSQQIYNDLQQKRRDLGLGDFDNSVPPEVDHFFNRLEGKE